MKRKELWQCRQATLIYNYYRTLFIRWILDIPLSVINLPTPDHCPHFIPIEMFRESDKVSGISRCCSYVSSLCVFSAYFLDLILLLAKVIMYKVHGTRCTFCNFTKIMSLVGCAATCLHYIKYSLHMGLLSRYCSVCAPVLLCSVAHLLHTDFNHILCPSTLPSSSSSSFGLYLLFLSAFRRVPTTLTHRHNQTSKESGS